MVWCFAWRRMCSGAASQSCSQGTTRLGVELGGGAMLRSAVRTDVANMAFLAMIQAYNTIDLQPLPSGDPNGSLGGRWNVGSAMTGRTRAEAGERNK
ncbi:LLM class F420-dependent oxidoreductase [Sesbania bispinosa]|nr:LLM class F420-dependent oxidoreductase [Sesbania bispinosa]